jgi:hypothetical protein
MVGVQDKGTVGGHSLGKVMHDGFGLDHETTKHFIRVPMAEKVNGIGINLCTKKHHSSSCTKRSCRGVFQKEAKLRASST